MSKRSAAEAAPGTPPPKKQTIDALPRPHLLDPDDDFTPAQSPSSTFDDASTVTAATTPRAKFPSDLKTLACTWPGCLKTFNRPARLRDHLNSHTNSRPFKCGYDGCDKDYIEDKHLKQHVKAVHTLERKHVCLTDGCGKSFTTGTRLKRHQAVHAGAERFRCSDCGQSFRKRDTLARHVRKDHLGRPEHVCPEAGCTVEFESKGSLNRHREREHGELKFWCGECGSRHPNQHVGFTTEGLLQGHLKREHQSCLFCEFRAASAGDFERHVEALHSGQQAVDRKTVACPYDGCSKRFTKRSNLNAHIRSAHHGVRFVCGASAVTAADIVGWDRGHGCGDTFSSKAKLEDHVRFVHLGVERPRLSRVEGRPNIIDDLSGAARQSFEDPAAFLSPGQLLDEQVDMDEFFAAEMEYLPQRDEWLDDQANILLLAREMGDELEDNIDPMLG